MPAPTRRDLLTAGLTGIAATALGSTAAAAGARPTGFRYCLNTSTLRGFKLPIAEVVEIAARARYDALEPWIDELQQHVAAGRSLPDLRKQIADSGLTVESAIGFTPWIVDDPQRRAAGLEETKRAMELVAAIGGRRIAAPPAGATDVQLSGPQLGERYRALLELGDQTGVVPQLELWGFSKTLSQLGEVLAVAADSRHPRACVLLDVYHLYKGGSDFAGLRLVSNEAMRVLHMNDYPAQPPRAEIVDAQRIYPGDGVAPLGDILSQLRGVGFDGVLSLELFNGEYWRQDPARVARTGLEKMKAVVAASS